MSRSPEFNAVLNSFEQALTKSDLFDPIQHARSPDFQQFLSELNLEMTDFTVSYSKSLTIESANMQLCTVSGPIRTGYLQYDGGTSIFVNDTSALYTIKGDTYREVLHNLQDALIRQMGPDAPHIVIDRDAPVSHEQFYSTMRDLDASMKVINGYASSDNSEYFISISGKVNNLMTPNPNRLVE